jgi:hypothetical protein
MQNYFFLKLSGFLHRTVQIIVTISNWDRSCSVLLNNIEQIAPKTGQCKELTSG